MQRDSPDSLCSSPFLRRNGNTKDEKKMLTESDKFYLQSHCDQDPAELLAAIGKKDTKKNRGEVEDFVSEARRAKEVKTNRSNVITKTAGGKKTVAIMTAAGSAEPVVGPGKGEIPSRHLRNSVHRIGDADGK